MSKAMNSPTARLLQHSRLFSLPRPLPHPNLDVASSTAVVRSSETATLPYPIRQAIATPRASHHRGDWGLKRPLPTRTTKHHTNPHIRVLALDNEQHFTDFESALDHTQTLAKWQEMSIPMTARRTRRTISGADRGAPVSVFEDAMDSTDPDKRQAQRWKYKGPWLAGMLEGEFEEWVTKGRRGYGGESEGRGSLKTQKQAWRVFLKEKYVARVTAERMRIARDEGLDPQMEIKKVLPRGSALKRAVENEEKRLRDQHDGFASELSKLLVEFLDLPTMADKVKDDLPDIKTPALRIHIENHYSESDYGPPSTHPSAGLSHIRSANIMENHPLYGPQARRSPVLGRVVRPRNTGSVQQEIQAKIGVGGIVANDTLGSSLQGGQGRNTDNMSEPDRMVYHLDPDLEGGNKLWVHPETAYVDEKARIHLDFSRGNREAIAVKTDNVESIPRIANPLPLPGNPPPGMSRLNAAAYGMSDVRRAQRPQQTRGFDEELAEGDGWSGADSAMSRVRQLLEGTGKSPWSR